MGDRQRGEQERGKDWVARRRLGLTPIVLRSGGLWGHQPWRPAATGPGLVCTPFRPAYRPALLTGLPADQPARGGERDGAVLIRLRAAPVRGFSGEQLRRLLLADAPGSPP